MNLYNYHLNITFYCLGFKKIEHSLDREVKICYNGSVSGFLEPKSIKTRVKALVSFYVRYESLH